MKATSIRSLMLWGGALAALTAYAQDDEEPIHELSPFVVDSSGDTGYRAMNTLSGSRLNTSLKDTAAPISVFTAELIADLGVTSFAELADWSVGSEVYYNEDEGNQNEMLFAGGANLKVRGLDASRGRNYYEWNLSSDNYNAERLELSSGPNAILFGLGSPGGIFNTSTKQARTNRDSLSFENRIGSYSFLRNAIDVNKVIVEDKLALRVNLLREEKESWRDWEYKDTERNHIALTWNVREGSTFRAEWEDGNFDSVGVRTYSTVTNFQTLAEFRLADGFDPLALYNPTTNPYGLYDPYPLSRVNHATPAQRINQNLTGAARDDTLTLQQRGRKIVYIHADNLNPQPVLMDVAGQVISRRVPNGLISVYDDPYVPNSSWIRGPHDIRDEKLETHSFSFEQKLSDHAYLDLGYNKQRTAFGHLGASAADGLELQWDLNATLPDGSPNPNAGRIFTESSIQNRSREIERETYRALISYDLGLEEHSKWAGNHRFAALYETADVFTDNARDKLVILENGLPGFNLADADNNLNGVFVRSYIEDINDPSTLLWDGPVWFENMPLSYSLPNNNNVRIAPIGQPLPTLSTRFSQTPNAEKLVTDMIDSVMAVMQNYWFQNRFITGYGVRKESLDQLLVTGDATTRSPDGMLLLDLRSLSHYENYSRNTSAVWHLNKAGNYSLFFNQGSNFKTPRTEHNIVGVGLAPVSRGESDDIGIKFDLFEGKLSGSLLKYQTTGMNRTENAGDTGTNAIFEYLNTQNTNLTPAAGASASDVAARAAIATSVFGSPDGRFRGPEGEVLTDASTTFLQTVNNAVVYDEVTDGYEFNLIANPTKSLRIFFNYSYSKTVGDSAGDEMIAYLDAVMPYFEGQIANSMAVDSQLFILNNPNLPALNPATHEFEIHDLLQDTQRRLYESFFSRMGADIRGQNREKANLRANYEWKEGFLKGWSLGGGVQWRSPAVIGHDIGGSTNFTQDLDGNGVYSANEYVPWSALKPFNLGSRVPIFGEEQTSYSLNFGYKTKVKIGERNANLSFQVNVDNLFDDRDPLYTQLRLIGGTNYPSQYRFINPRQINLTSSIKF